VWFRLNRVLVFEAGLSDSVGTVFVTIVSFQHLRDVYSRFSVKTGQMPLTNVGEEKGYNPSSRNIRAKIDTRLCSLVSNAYPCELRLCTMMIVGGHISETRKIFVSMYVRVGTPIRVSNPLTVEAPKGRYFESRPVSTYCHAHTAEREGDARERLQFHPNRWVGPLGNSSRKRHLGVFIARGS